MDRIWLKSNDLQSVGYDESLYILEIQFHHGGIYRYFGVSKKIYDGLMKSVLSQDSITQDTSKTDIDMRKSDYQKQI